LGRGEEEKREKWEGKGIDRLGRGGKERLGLGRWE
jgi:hypothetical protein